MADKPSPKSSERSRLTRIFLGGEQKGKSVLARLSPAELALGLLLALSATVLVVEFEFGSVPGYQVGDIAEQDIKAPHDFTVEDREATLQKREQARLEAPAVFDLDLTVNRRVETELRGAFADARQRLAEERARLGLEGEQAPGPRQREELLSSLAGGLPRFDQGQVLEICLKYGFSQELEDQLAALVREALRPPGVVLSRNTLVRFQERGIMLRNTIFPAQDRALEDWTVVRDLDQARDVLRQHEYRLTRVEGQEKAEIIAFLDGWLVPNVHYNEAESAALEGQYMQEVDPVLIQVKAGRTLVRAGDEISARVKVLLDQLSRLQQSRDVGRQFFGVLLIVAFFLFAIWHYFLSYQKRHQKIRSHFVLLGLVLVISLALTKAVLALADVVARSVNLESLQDPLNFYFLAPLALGAILLILLVDVDVSILYSVIFAVFVGLMTGEMVMFVYALTGSLAAIYLLDRYRERSAIIKGGLVIGLVNLMTVFALALYAPTTGIDWMNSLVRMGAALISGLFAAMLGSLMLPVLEMLFGITTDIKLLELSNLNNPILRRMAVEAPGTYHHSIIVGTLAEAAAEAIGASTLLVRVGAYYHDMGKLKKPEYYVENQIYAGNKHEDLAPSISSLILANHVKDGLAIADEINLVPKVRDLIPQHHGTRLMTYFYQKAKEEAEGTDRDVDESDFRYPGPKPQTREAAILMLADQVEAAARTLQDPSPRQIRQMIRRLIRSNIEDRQFDECDVTMRDFEKMTQAFERTITGMHHHRIEYPGFDFNTQREEERPENQRIQ